MAPFWEQGGLWRSQGEWGWWHWWLSPLPGVAESHVPIGTFSPAGAHRGQGGKQRDKPTCVPKPPQHHLSP